MRQLVSEREKINTKKAQLSQVRLSVFLLKKVKLLSLHYLFSGFNNMSSVNTILGH